MRVLTTAFLVWFGVAALPAAKAANFNYPKAAPVLSVTMPDGWTVTEMDGSSRMLLCAPPGDENYTIILLSMPTIGNRSDLETILSRITRAGAEGAGLTGVTVSQAVQGTVGTGTRAFTRITASGKHEDEAGAYVFYAFPMPGTGKYYAVGVAGLQAMIDAHRAEFEAVAQSIRPCR